MVDSSPSVLAFGDLLNGPFATYLELSDKIGAEVKDQAHLVQQAFQHEYEFVKLAAQCQQPSAAEILDLLRPVSEKILAVQDLRERNRANKLFNQLSAVSESVAALGWVTVAPTPGPYVKEMSDAGQFYSNRVLVEFKDKDQTQVDWVKAWIGTLSELQKYVRQHHTTGLAWNPKGEPLGTKKTVGARGPPPPPPPPGSPPPAITLEDLSAGSADSRAALFSQLNKGEDITKSLKKVTADQQTHKNPSLRSQAAVSPQKSSGDSNNAGPKPVSGTTKKPPVFALQGKKWMIEHHVGNKNLVVDKAEMNQAVYVYSCVDSAVVVKGKVNSIVLDACKKTCLVFDDIVSSVEFINCQRIQAQAMGKVPTVLIDKTDGVQVYLGKESLSCEIVSSKSSEMNLMVAKEDGDFDEYPIPEQYKTTWRGKGIVTEVVEQKG